MSVVTEIFKFDKVCLNGYFRSHYPSSSKKQNKTKTKNKKKQQQKTKTKQFFINSLQDQFTNTVTYSQIPLKAPAAT